LEVLLNLKIGERALRVEEGKFMSNKYGELVKYNLQQSILILSKRRRKMMEPNKRGTSNVTSTITRV